MTSGPYVVQIWSRNTLYFRGNETLVLHRVDSLYISVQKKPVVDFGNFRRKDTLILVPWCRGTSLIRNRLLLGPYSRAMPRDPWWPYGGGGSYGRGTPVPTPPHEVAYPKSRPPHWVLMCQLPTPTRKRWVRRASGRVWQRRTARVPPQP